MVDLLKEELISSLKNELVILNFENDCKKICKKVLTDNNVCVIMNIQTNQGGRDMSEIKLLPCPFCGGESLLRDRYAIGVASTKHYIRECRHCKATFAHRFRSIKKANEAWNRRANLGSCENELIVRGEWKPIFKGADTCECSVCKSKGFSDSDFGFIATPYCPNCGAEMEVEP
jgi:Lar family restriction alleviation protein